MKKILTSAIAILAMVGCTSEDFVGDKELQRQNENGLPISFDLIAAPQTRAPQTGATAATTLNNNFVVYATKTISSASQVVFNNYQANYLTGSENTTTSNSAGWEYVGYTNVPGGVTTNVGVTTFAASSNNTNGREQSIKYWDYNASKYEFFAYSLGAGYTTTTGTPTTTYATSTAMSATGYSLSGSANELGACYISNKNTINSPTASTASEVDLEFLNLTSKVRIALYETIPGYSVKDVKFYSTSDATSSSTTAYLYASSGTMPSGNSNTYNITFDSNGKAQIALATGGTTSTNLSFGVADATDADVNQWDNWAHRDYKEVPDADVAADENADTLFIGRTSTAATISEPQTVLPNPNGAVLNLKVDYTLVSRDGYGENIQVTNAMAVVPAAYAQWQPNCTYTYLFKITDQDLVPITLDAIVTTDVNGKQETITTVTDPSITTYQNGSDVLADDEYKAGTIYVVVDNGTSLTVGTNAKLYTAVATLADPDNDVANITEASVANAIANPTDAKDANGNPLALTDVSSGLTAITEIAAGDSPTGVAITVNGAKFTATAGTTYVFEYIYTESSETKKAYKVIKVD